MRREAYYAEIKDHIAVMDKCTTEMWDAKYHFHDDYEVYLFLGGDVDLYIEQSLHHMQRGHLAVFNDRQLHRACHHGTLPYERLAVHFLPGPVASLSTPATNLLGCFQNRADGEDPVILLGEESTEELAGLIRRLKRVTESEDYGADVLSLSLLSQLLVNVNLAFRHSRQEQPAHFDRLIGEIMSYVDEHLQEELSLERIAADFSLSRSYLGHLFRRQTGGTLYHYILMKRTAAAKRYLAEGRSVTETCELAGFSDYSNFIRTFRNMTGLSPRRYGQSVGREG